MSENSNKVSDIFRAAMGKFDSRHRVGAIIVAAGSSSRMGGDTTKQMMELCGMPVVVRTLLAFQKNEYIKEIVVAAREDEVERYSDFKEEYALTKLTSVVPGGETRQGSVIAALEKISDKTDYIAIHDGARPFVTDKIIDDAVRAAYKYGAVCAAVPAKDTAKYADAKGYIDHTVDRAFLWYAQTPQVFKTNLYRAAAYSALEKGFAATDDCMLAEEAGFRVKLIPGSEENIKITTPHDLEIGEAIIKKRGEEECE